MAHKYKTDFPFVGIPDVWNGSVTVEKKEGTRWYEERGDVVHFHQWMKEINEKHPANLIPLQWVPDFIGVARASLLSRAKKGGLTVFSFIVTTASKTFLGGCKERETKKRYDYAVISECYAWRDILMERAERRQIEKEKLTGGN